MTLDKIFQLFCEQDCNHRETDYPLWKKLEPCLNCPAEEFMEHLQVVKENE